MPTPDPVLNAEIHGSANGLQMRGIGQCAELPSKWFKGFVDAGGKGLFVQLPPHKDNGHGIFPATSVHGSRHSKPFSRRSASRLRLPVTAFRHRAEQTSAVCCHSPTTSAPAGGVNLKVVAGRAGLRSIFVKRISVV